MTTPYTPTRSDVFERCASGVVTIVQALGLLQFDGKTAVSVYKQTLPDERSINLPCVLVTFEDGTEEEGEHATEAQYVNYPVNVLLVDRQPPEDQTWRPGYLGWRKQLMDAFRPLQTLPGCPEVWDVRIKPERAIPSDLFTNPKYQYAIGRYVVMAYTAEDWIHGGSIGL